MAASSFWNIAPWSLVEINQRSRGALMTEEANTSETSVNLYQTTQRNIPDDRHLFCPVKLARMINGRIIMNPAEYGLGGSGMAYLKILFYSGFVV
jgi:hypothetical protein